MTPHFSHTKLRSLWKGTKYSQARFYDPALARWHAVDPLADSYLTWSPYNNVMGNPISLIDPTGMGPEDPPSKKTFTQSQIGGMINRAIMESAIIQVQKVKNSFRITQFDPTFMLLDDVVTLITGENLEGEQSSRAVALGFIALDLVPGGGIVKTGVKFSAKVGKGTLKLVSGSSKIISKGDDLVKATGRLSDDTGKAIGKEVIAFTKDGTMSSAKKLLHKLIGNSNELEPMYGAMKHNSGLVVGFKTADGKTKFRIDWDDAKGAHFNYEISGEKGAIIIDNLSEASVNVIQDVWTRAAKK